MRISRIYFIAAWVAVALTLGLTFATSSSSTTVGVLSAASGVATVKSRESVTDYSLYFGQAPSWNPVVGSAGSITGGDLFVIEPVSGYSGNLLVTIYLVNAGDVSQRYTYLNMDVRINKHATLNASNKPGSWESTSAAADYLTLTNGFVSFVLENAGGNYYSIGLGGGSLYTYSGSGGSLSPQFYVTVTQA